MAREKDVVAEDAQDYAAVIAQMQKQMTEMQQQLLRAQSQPDTATLLMERMLEIQQQQAKALEEQSARTLPKENPNYTAKSPFLKPSGEPWAADLKCDIYFGPIRLNRTVLTEDEVKALNALKPVEKAPLTKTDGSVVRATVRPRENAVGKVERLTIELPMKKDDNPQHFPSLLEIARQLAA